MGKEQKVPQVRFKGFADAWEQRKVSDMFTERNEQAPMSEEYPLMAFIANVGVAPKGERYDRSALVNDEAGKKYKRTEKGDFIYSSNNLETGSIGLNNYGNACISPVYSIFKSKHNADSDFLGRMLLRKDFISQMVHFRQGVVYGQWKIHESDFLNLNIRVPCLAEQEQIGQYFRNLDNLITLHQRKCDTLQKLKKSMLQKMFPKNGSLYPEIRFKGFTDAWEQREFSSVFTTLQNNTLSRADLVAENGAAMNVHYGDILVKFGEVLDLDSEVLPYIESEQIAIKYKSSFLQNGDVIIADTAEDEAVGKCTEIANIGDFDVVSGLHTIPVRPQQNFASGYLGYYMNSNSYHDTLLPLMQGTKVTSISKSALQGTRISYPADYREQEQIGTYFRNLDHLITLHQRKLETLKKVKKSMLQKMFI